MSVQFVIPLKNSWQLSEEINVGRMTRTLTIFLAHYWLAAILTIAAPLEFSGRVVGIADGDTITVLHNGVAERVRLYGIDCPEKSQAFYRAAKEYAAQRSFQKTVTVRVKGRDRWNRTIGEVVLPSGQLLNHQLVRQGLAWWFHKYAAENEELHVMQEEARAAKRGIWVDANPVPPWEFRKHSRKDVPHPSSSTKQESGALFFSNASGTLIHQD
jgi:micrococcal nuclease